MTLWMRATFLALWLSSVTLTGVAADWPQWRGPQFNGHASGPELPTHWSDESVVWRTPLSGIGQSTPIVSNGAIFLTSSDTDGHRRYVVCLDRQSGATRWTRTIKCEQPNVKHNMNSFASASCVTDGKHVAAFFGRGGIHCFDHEGKLQWSRDDLGSFAGPWGTAASPAMVGNLVIQNCDADEDAYLVALDKASGETVWRTPRDNYRGWSTPFLLRTKARDELVLNGHRGVRAYDPDTGKELWFCQGFNGRGSPTPVFVEGKKQLVVINGLSGDIYAVRPGGNGNVTETHMVWHTRRSGRDLPSPIVVDRFLFTIGLRGFAMCYDIDTGEELWKERLGGIFTASPIASGGRVFVPNDDGVMFVIQPDTKLNIVAKNRLNSADGELFRASITPHDGQMLIRSNTALYCVQ